MTKNASGAEETRDKSFESEQESSDERRSHKLAPHRSVLFRIQKYAHRKCPSVVPDPQRHEILEQMREYDEIHNSESEPPEPERINLQCVWAIEFYTPSHIAELVDRLEKLDWTIDESSRSLQDPALWILHQRESANRSGWLNLGIIRRPGATGSIRPVRSAPLPSGVEYAVASLYNVTSSLTCIVMAFVLDEMQNRCYEEILRTNRKTYADRLSHRRTRFVQPEHQKKREVSRFRATIREHAADWFRTHLPGIFSTDILAGEFPTCEFLTLRSMVPFPTNNSSDQKASRWLHLLGLDPGSNAWQADELTGLKFAWPQTGGLGTNYHSIVAAQEDVFSEEALRLYAANDRNDVIHYVDRFVNNMLVLWALVCMLSGFERYLNNIRDSAVFNNTRKEKPLRLLDDVGRHIAQSVDIAAASVELQQFADRQRILDYSTNTFRPCNPSWYQNAKITLSEVFKTQITERATWIRSLEGSVRSLLIEYGTTVGVRENIKLQRHVALLTWVIVVLTLVVVILTALSTAISVNTGSLSWLP